MNSSRETAHSHSGNIIGIKERMETNDCMAKMMFLGCFGLYVAVAINPYAALPVLAFADQLLIRR